MVVLCTFKIKIEGQILNMSVLSISDHIQINIKMPNPSQEPPASSKVPNEDLKDMDVLCTFKIKKENQNLDHDCIKDQWPYPNQDQDAKPQSGTSSIIQSPKWWPKGHECSLHLQNQDREQKFGTWVYQRPVTISKSRSRCQTPVNDLQYPQKTQIRTLEHGCTKEHRPYPNQDQDPKPQSGTFIVLQNPI